MYLIVIETGGRGIGCSMTERIKSSIARADDSIVQDNERILVNTKFPAEFVTEFYADGFDHKLEVEPCEEF